METASNWIDGGSYTYQNGYEIVWWTPNKTKTKTVYKRKHWYSISKSYFEEYSEEPVIFGRGRIDPAGESLNQIDAKGVKEAAKKLVKFTEGRATTLRLEGKYPPNKL
jgi:hypothetical protein